MRERPRARTVVLTAGTVAAALPFVVLGLQSVAGQEVPLLVVAGLAVTAGVPFDVAGTTNLLKIETV